MRGISLLVVPMAKESLLTVMETSILVSLNLTKRMDLESKRIRRVTTLREILFLVPKQVLAQKIGGMAQHMRVSGNITISKASATTSGLKTIRVIKVSIFMIKSTGLA